MLNDGKAAGATPPDSWPHISWPCSIPVREFRARSAPSVSSRPPPCGSKSSHGCVPRATREVMASARFVALTCKSSSSNMSSLFPPSELSSAGRTRCTARKLFTIRSTCGHETRPRNQPCIASSQDVPCGRSRAAWGTSSSSSSLMVESVHG
eukprot:1678047-Heterocapsa_arctica.AAC.1